MRPRPSLTWPVLALAAMFATAGAREAAAEGVLLVSGATASAPELDRGLALPDASLAGLDALSLAARRLAAGDDDLLLWFPARGEALRLSALAPDVRVRYACLAHDTEALHPDRTRFAEPPAEADNPSAWVLSERGRLIWWSEIPGPGASCNLTLRFAPAVTGPASGQFQAPDTGGGAISVPLTGTSSERPEVIFASRFEADS